ncbi:CorA family divalent cation transporter [Ramlibacter sp. 2FC]|uniref:CorA family divalent cation transporter n=1 Tax=Ramlibacter sp. 2FC TaxID=2502188 RepID=UPI00201DA6B7|nr:CorA family divalent cation transporter [Ramlibacter sp. 2FC]
MPLRDTQRPQLRPWDLLREAGEASPWRERVDEYTGDREQFHERHYNEFVSFLPYVQRFLYGEGRAHGKAQGGGESPMRVFRRHDIAALRTVARPGDAPITLSVVHIDLYFFFDVDVVLLNVEVCADDLPLPVAQEQLYRFGRAYPGGWDEDGAAQNCLASVEWLDARGNVLARSDAQQREAFLSHVCEHRAPRIAAHWAYLMQPLVSDHSGEPGQLRYRQIEYYRMPLMAYLAVDDPRRLTRQDFIRLGLVTAPGGPDNALPYSEQHLADFEQRCCYDRFWVDAGTAPRTRYLCSGHALVVVGDARSSFFRCRDRGVLAQFKHQHFLLFLIAHFQKAALLMFSDQLVEALKRLDIHDPDSVKRFKRAIRASFERFLRFTHRYWFHEISEQAQVRALSHMCASHLGLDPLYDEVKQRIADMNSYLETDSLRRQANTVVRLTVVTLFGLIGTVTTGFLGMNLLAEADAPLSRKLLWFGVVAVLTTILTFYTMVKSKRLSDFIDAMSDERLTLRQRLGVLARVWKPGSD